MIWELMYADNLALLAESIFQLQRIVAELKITLLGNGLNIKITKIKVFMVATDIKPIKVRNKTDRKLQIPININKSIETDKMRN